MKRIGTYRRWAALFLLPFLCLIAACAAKPGAGDDGGNGGNGGEEPAFAVGTYTLDASLADWTARDKENALFIPVAGGQSARIYAKKLVEGVVIAVEARHHRYVTTSANTLSNSNFRFTFSDGEQPRYVTAVGESAGVSEHAVRSASDGKMRSTVFELFVGKDKIADFGGQLRFGFRLHLSGYQEDYFWGYGGDWRIDGSDVGKCPYYITENGITGKLPLSGVDGVSGAEWEGAEAIVSGYNGYGTINMLCRMEEDGVYLFLDATHRECNRHQYWCYNPNFEIRLGVSPSRFDTFRVVTYSDDLSLHSATAGGAVMCTEYDEDAGMYRSVCEMFVPYENIPGGGQGVDIRVGAAFRADENDVEPWSPVYDESGRPTWGMDRLAITEGGWKVL